MQYLKLDDDAYWQNTGRYQKLARPVESFGDDAEPELRARYEQVKARYFPLDERDDEHTVVPLVITYPPQTKLSRHAHQCGILFVVLRGKIYAPDGLVLEPGDCCYAMAHEYYGPMLVGADGATALEIFTSPDAIGTDHLRPDGTEHIWRAFSDDEREFTNGYDGFDELFAAMHADLART